LTQRVLIIGSVWVEPNSSAAGSRMLQLIELFLKQNWNVTFAATAERNKNAFNLESLGVKEVSIELNAATFDDFIQQLKPSIVLFDRFTTEEQFGWRVAEYCPTGLRILDTEDLHFLRKVRYQQYKKGEDFTNEALLKSEDTKREIASILRCDLSLIISAFEMELLQPVFKIDESLLYYLPFLLDRIDKTCLTEWNSFEERNHFLFIGNFLHKPNVDAVLTLKNRIWPSIKSKIPEAEMHVYGAYVTQQIKELHNLKEGFLIKGFAQDSKEVFQNAKVVLAPLNFGAGIKGKLTEAMSFGTPTVTTTIGSEGMHNNLPWNGFVTDDLNNFSEKAVELYNNKVLWKSSQKKGITIINSIYDKEKLSNPFVDRIRALQQDIDSHRTQNFIGSLLQHQTLKATKYMSKWIEAKNQNQSLGGS